MLLMNMLGMDYAVVNLVSMSLYFSNRHSILVLVMVVLLLARHFLVSILLMVPMFGCRYRTHSDLEMG